jgi:hypothetical protein
MEGDESHQRYRHVGISIRDRLVAVGFNCNVCGVWYTTYDVRPWESEEDVIELKLHKCWSCRNESRKH